MEDTAEWDQRANDYKKEEEDSQDADEGFDKPRLLHAELLLLLRHLRELRLCHQKYHIVDCKPVHHRQGGFVRREVADYEDFADKRSKVFCEKFHFVEEIELNNACRPLRKPVFDLDHHHEHPEGPGYLDYLGPEVLYPWVALDIFLIEALVHVQEVALELGGMSFGHKSEVNEIVEVNPEEDLADQQPEEGILEELRGYLAVLNRPEGPPNGYHSFDHLPELDNRPLEDSLLLLGEDGLVDVIEEKGLRLQPHLVSRFGGYEEHLESGEGEINHYMEPQIILQVVLSIKLAQWDLQERHVEPDGLRAYSGITHKEA